MDNDIEQIKIALKERPYKEKVLVALGWNKADYDRYKTFLSVENIDQEKLFADCLKAMSDPVFRDKILIALGWDKTDYDGYKEYNKKRCRRSGLITMIIGIFVIVFAIYLAFTEYDNHFCKSLGIGGAGIFGNGLRLIAKHTDLGKY